MDIERAHIYNLAPDTKFMVSDGKKHLTYGETPKEIVSLINELHGYHLTQFIFANNKPLIDHIANLINANPFKQKES